MKHLGNTPEGDSIVLVSTNELSAIKRLLGQKLRLSALTLSRITEAAQRILGDKPEITGAVALAVLGAYDIVVPGAVLLHQNEDGEIGGVEV